MSVPFSRCMASPPAFFATMGNGCFNERVNILTLCRIYTPDGPCRRREFQSRKQSAHAELATFCEVIHLEKFRWTTGTGSGTSEYLERISSGVAFLIVVLARCFWSTRRGIGTRQKPLVIYLGVSESSAIGGPTAYLPM